MGITVGSTNGKNIISTTDDISQNSEDKRNHRKDVLVVQKVKYENLFFQLLWQQIQKAMPRALG